MKYSVKGHLNISDDTELAQILNSYVLKRLSIKHNIDLNRIDFEAVQYSETNRDSTINNLKPLINNYGGYVVASECEEENGNITVCTMVYKYPETVV